MLGRIAFALEFRKITGKSFRNGWIWSKHWANVCGGPFNGSEENRQAARFCALRLGYDVDVYPDGDVR